MPKFSVEGKYLKHQELDGKDWVFTITSFKHENLGKDEEKEMKWVLYFEEMEKGFALNKTNGVVICELYGEEMNDWVGKKITLYEKDDVEFAGKLVSAIRVRRKVPV
jgi:hypothetical protein